MSTSNSICRNHDSPVWKVHEAEVNFRFVYEREPRSFPAQVQQALFGACDGKMWI